MSVITFPFTLTDPSPRLRIVRDWATYLPAQSWLHAWYSFRPEFVTQDGNGAIQTLIDRSGRGRNFAEPNAAVRPRLQPNAINGHSAGIFSAHGLRYNGEFPMAAYSKIAVVYVSPQATGDGTIIGNTSTTQAHHRLYAETGQARARHQVANGAEATGNPAVGGLTPGKWHVVIGTFDGATGALDVSVDDGPPVTIIDPDLKAVVNNQFFIGYGNLPGGVPSTPFNGLIADVQILNVPIRKASEEAARADVRDFIGSVYGVAI